MQISMLQNSDSTPALFSGVAANVGITFVLETVNRKATSKSSWELETL
jgi:hypothetical protein